ncbi:hypothetical protein Agabi119p4_2686 [Agaricus bisporus var. burnettii]|uniref:Uncharacterized protein n=1 Tax=Agaricus bisporus var. burnettii TaxID=192524 RepID=A0A8H7F9P2_AGABI|nr:hypothetical protein Agabi119p4_2686 [Agaricus bisporus var. burnettii]
MLTVLGVVIGFVISYRASSGYDRYWLGRTYWSEVVRNARTMGRLIWFHVPPRSTPRRPEEEAAHVVRPAEEMVRVMSEKTMALDLIEGFAVALKHHVRDELGIYYHDLYHLVKPLHDHQHTTFDFRSPSALTPSRAKDKHLEVPTPQPMAPSKEVPSPSLTPDSNVHPIIPAINSYGTFDPSQLRTPLPSNSSSSSLSEPLLTMVQPRKKRVISKYSFDLVPFTSVITSFFRSDHDVTPDIEQNGTSSSRWRPLQLWRGPSHTGITGVATTGDVLPLEILRHISNWLSALEDRGTVPGTSLGQMISLERILTTPLPFVYSVHIRTVWIYLFLLPFQIVEQFCWYTIPGVSLAAFIYLGFVSAGEEIEQPFGYDEDDLDLDLFCLEIHNDMKHLKKTPCVNSYLESDASRPQSEATIEVA